MSDDFTLVWDDAAVAEWVQHSPQFRAALDQVVAHVTVTMKAAIPVSPVYPVYARPVTSGRAAGDLPLRPSGYLRSSVRAERQPDGDVIIGTAVDYARYVNDDTVAHEIRSHGPWPLRSRATGQVFGPVVRHPGTRGHHFVEKAAASVQGMRVDVG